MNYEQKLGGGMPKTPDQESQGAKPIAENKPNISESTILGTSKDENFPGSTIFKIQRPDGKIKGYAIRIKEDGTFEGNEINYQPDGSMGTVQRLNEADLERIRQEGVLDKFQSIKSAEEAHLESQRKIEQTKKLDNANIWSNRLFLQGKNPYITYQLEPNEQMYIDEAVKALQALSDDEQASLAEAFLKDHDRSEKFHYVMVKLGNTAFGKKLAELAK
jgi:hypothetical protein